MQIPVKCVAFFATLAICSVNAQSPQDYARKGALSWAAFECSSAARYTENMQAEEERLFKVGYRLGIEFLSAIKAGKVSNEDVYKGVPWQVLGRLQGPNHEFILGRIAEAAIENGTTRITKIDEKSISADLRKRRAEFLYVEWHCELLGRSN